MKPSSRELTSSRSARPTVAALALLSCAALAAGPLLSAHAAPSAAQASSTTTTRTVTTWGASDDMAGGQLTDKTVRNVVHTSIGGTGLRVRLSNAKGDRPLVLDSVYVGTSGGGAAVVAGTNRRLTFNGGTAVTIPPGATALSDPLAGEVKAQQTLAVSIHVSGTSGPLTAHNRTMQQTYSAGQAGDFTSDESGAHFDDQSATWWWLDGILLEVPKQSQSVATLGDSITAGVGTTLDANRRWPDVLADRLAELPPVRQMGVVNEGISGNRVLSGISRPGGAGDAALSRLERDVLTKPGVDTVLLLEGVNDIGAGSSAQEIIAGYKMLVARTHAAGRCVVAGTILPFGGSVFADPEGEVVRAEVNRFIRTTDIFDGVVDFAAATQDPTDHTKLRAEFFGDGLHPNDAGNKAMGEAIDLDTLRCDR